MLTFHFASKRCIVTGAGSGMGRDIVRGFLAAGARVAGVDASAAGLATWDDEVAAGRVRTYVTDVSDADAVQEQLGAAVVWLGGCDVLINAAGVIRNGDALTMSEADFDLVMDVNLKGPFLCSQVAGRAMREQGGGCIVNITSVEAEVANPGHVAYTASKGGLRMLTQAMAAALAPDDIRVNAVGPGAIATPMGAGTLTTQEERDRLFRRVLRGRVGKTSEITNAVMFLASDEADYITGTTLYVDGGVLGTR